MGADLESSSKRLRTSLRLWPALSILLGAFSVRATPPFIEHSPPTVEPGKEILFRAKISAPGGVYGPELLWRAGGSSRWTRLPMRLEGDVWIVALPAREVPRQTLEYYVEAYEKTTLDEGTWRSRHDPERLEMAQPPGHAEPPPSPKPPTGSSDAPGGPRSPTRFPEEAAERTGSFLLRGELGGGFVTFAGHVPASESANQNSVDMTSNGVAFGVAAGVFLHDNLALAASFWNAYGISPTVSPAPPLQEAKNSLVGLGPQLIYYALPSDVSVSAMAGLCGQYLNSNSGAIHLNNLRGFGTRVVLSKEWDIAGRWAAGVGGQIAYAIGPSEAGGSGHLSSWMYGFTVTATHRKKERENK